MLPWNLGFFCLNQHCFCPSLVLLWGPLPILLRGSQFSRRPSQLRPICGRGLPKQLTVTASAQLKGPTRPSWGQGALSDQWSSQNLKNAAFVTRIELWSGAVCILRSPHVHIGVKKQIIIGLILLSLLHRIQNVKDIQSSQWTLN